VIYSSISLSLIPLLPLVLTSLNLICIPQEYTILYKLNIINVIEPCLNNINNIYSILLLFVLIQLNGTYLQIG
jgi:hypothetical protein